MSSARLLKRVPSAEYVAVAKLKGHEIKYHKKSSDKSAKCDISSTNNENDIVIGVVFEIDEADKAKLDDCEGLGKGYDEKVVEVLWNENSLVTAVTYCATNIDASLKPYTWYREHVLRGAREFKLPDDYIEKYLNVDAIVDHKAGRHLKELSIYRD